MSTLHLLFPWTQYTIAAYGDDQAHCEVDAFLLDRSRLSAAADKAFRELFIWHGNHGQIRNNEKCNYLGDRIFEYKAPGGGRIAWFYDESFLVICACGVVKKKQKANPGFITKAAAIREKYFEEKKRGEIHRLF